MFYKTLILIIISSVVVSPRLLPEVEVNDETTTDVVTTPSTDGPRNIQICTDLRPDFISTRNGRIQTLECMAKICNVAPDGDTTILTDSSIKFNSPLFDWNCQFGHITASNGTCDYDRHYCWHSIDIDIKSFQYEMKVNDISEVQLSCSVTDSFSMDYGLVLAIGMDDSYLKNFRGKAIDESCEKDHQCGDNMNCLDLGYGGVCQCSVEYTDGVQAVAVLDNNYNERICVKPVVINETCDYDQQCQAMDVNSVCAQPDSDKDSGICLCNEGMVYYESGCQQKEEESIKPSIIWWIWTNDYTESDESSAHRLWWLRTASYLIAILAIFLPIMIILTALVMLCYRRVVSGKVDSMQTTVARSKFPAPKIVINDFHSKEKSDDKYNLVSNDYLNKQ